MALKLGNITFQNPLPVLARITARLGQERLYGGHEGYDLAAPAGTNILAAADGVVRRVGYMKDGYGYYVELEHEGGVRTLYGHMLSRPQVAEDETVRAGDVLGQVGSTGYSTGPHLHFHIQDAAGRYLDVGQYIDFAVAGVQRAAKLPAELWARLQNDPCIKGTTDVDSYNLCREQEGLDPVSEDVFTTLREAWTQSEQGAEWEEKAGRSLYDEIGEGLAGAVLKPLENAIYNVAFFVPRTLINTFDLADGGDLDSGKATYEWLKQSENSKLFLASSVALLLVFILIVVTVGRFLAEPAKQAVNVATNPVGSALEQVS